MATTEYRILRVPDQGENSQVDYIFQFSFTIKKTVKDSKESLDISFKLELNPKLKSPSDSTSSSPPSPPTPTVYHFKDGECNFVHTSMTNPNYVASGNIKVIDFTKTMSGQFDHNTKNFLFNIKYGEKNVPPYQMMGLFPLTTPSKSPKH